MIEPFGVWFSGPRIEHDLYIIQRGNIERSVTKMMPCPAQIWP